MVSRIGDISLQLSAAKNLFFRLPVVLAVVDVVLLVVVVGTEILRICGIKNNASLNGVNACHTECYDLYDLCKTGVISQVIA